ncbi:hypothetical protein [Lysobacter sp. A289]
MKIRYKVGLWIVGCLLALSTVVGLLALVFVHTFYPDAPEADYPPAQDLATAQRQDLDYFQNYFTLNRAYSPEALVQAKALHDEGMTNAGTLSPTGFALAVSRMVALSDNGHSSVSKGYLATHNNRIPCRFYHFADGYYVIRAKPKCAELLGAKLLTIDGMPIDTVADRMYAYTLGPRNHYDQFIVQIFVESPEILHAAGFATRSDRISLGVQMLDGSQRAVTVIADPPDANSPSVYSDSFLSPRRIDGESEEWRTLLPRDIQLPQFLREYDNPFQTAWWPDQQIYYVQFRSNMDEPGHPIGKFIAHVEQGIAADKPRFIVLDLRLNQGGDFTKTASLMKHIATLTDSIQHVYVLTSAWTFSAGNVSLALVKEHGGDKVTVIGEPAGDRVRIWAEGGSLALPNSKIRVYFATGYHDYTKPCWGERGCFWITLLFPMHVPSFEPDIRVPYTFDDYTSLRDPMLDKAGELASGLRKVDSK